jgi:hypothetical protein
MFQHLLQLLVVIRMQPQPVSVCLVSHSTLKLTVKVRVGDSLGFSCNRLQLRPPIHFMLIAGLHLHTSCVSAPSTVSWSQMHTTPYSSHSQGSKSKKFTWSLTWNLEYAVGCRLRLTDLNLIHIILIAGQLHTYINSFSTFYHGW